MNLYEFILPCNCLGRLLLQQTKINQKSSIPSTSAPTRVPVLKDLHEQHGFILYGSTVNIGICQWSICPRTGTKFPWKKCTVFVPTYKCQVSEFWNNNIFTPETLSVLLSPALQHNQNNARSMCVYDRKHHVTPRFSSSLLQNEAV